MSHNHGNQPTANAHRRIEVHRSHRPTHFVDNAGCNLLNSTSCHDLCELAFMSTDPHKEHNFDPAILELGQLQENTPQWGKTSAATSTGCFMPITAPIGI